MARKHCNWLGALAQRKERIVPPAQPPNARTQQPSERNLIGTTMLSSQVTLGFTWEWIQTTSAMTSAVKWNHWPSLWSSLRIISIILMARNWLWITCCNWIVPNCINPECYNKKCPLFLHKSKLRHSSVLCHQILWSRVSYSGGSRFNTRPEDRLSWQTFSGRFKQMLR